MKSYHDVKNIFQVLILSDGIIPDDIPSFISDNKKIIMDLYPESAYRLWSGNEIRQVIYENFAADVLEAYDCLKPFAYKADLARYVLLYLYGGLYIDLGVTIKNRWNIPRNCEVAACRDMSFVTPTWIAIQNGLLWSLPRSKEFLNAINYIVSNCKHKYYGINPLYPTGPVLLGRAFIASFLDKELGYECNNQYVGECKPITPDSDIKNIAYISKSGDFIAFRKKKIPGDLCHLGIKNGNNYNFMWQTRTVYGENIQNPVLKIWSAAGPEIRATSKALQDQKGIHVKNIKGRVSYGPYIRLPAGRYAIKVYFSCETKMISVLLELSHGNNNDVMYRFRKYIFTLKDNFFIVFPFSLYQMSEKIEFRVCFRRRFSGSIVKIELLYNE